MFNQFKDSFSWETTVFTYQTCLKFFSPFFLFYNALSFYFFCLSFFTILNLILQVLEPSWLHFYNHSGIWCYSNRKMLIFWQVCFFSGLILFLLQIMYNVKFIRAPVSIYDLWGYHLQIIPISILNMSLVTQPDELSSSLSKAAVSSTRSVKKGDENQHVMSNLNYL